MKKIELAGDGDSKKKGERVATQTSRRAGCSFLCVRKMMIMIIIITNLMAMI